MKEVEGIQGGEATELLDRKKPSSVLGAQEASQMLRSLRSCGFFLQDDPLLNRSEAWPAWDFPHAHFHYFRESGCIMTSLWNMCCIHRVPHFQDDFPTPWELNEACKAKGAFYPTANIELALLHKVVPVGYLDRFDFEEAALAEQLSDGVMCLLRVNGQSSRYHYVLPLEASEGELRCFDPKAGYTNLGNYQERYQIIRFQRLW